MSLSIFSIPSTILDALDETVPEPTVATLSETISQKRSLQRLAADRDDRAVGLSCSSCGGPVFVDIDEQRKHFKSDWHRYNQRLSIKGQTPLNEAAFEELEELSSIEASGDEEDDESSSDGDELSRNREGLEEHEKGARVNFSSPFVTLLLRQSPDNVNNLSGDGGANTSKIHGARKAIRVYKQALQPKSFFSEDVSQHELVRALQNLSLKVHAPNTSASARWTLIMVASGHFAGAVFDCDWPSASSDIRPLAHKTFHRYTTRRKQGGAQGGNDNAKGKANSAGAMLRRYNEQALQMDIKNLLTEWQQYLSTSTAIFIHVPVRSRKLIFFEGGKLDPKDPRIRTFPFITKRPTLSELIRCFKELATASIVEVLDVLPPETPIALERSLQSVPASSQSSIPTVTDIPKAKRVLDERTAKLIDLCRRGKDGILKTVMTSWENPPDLSTRLYFEEGTSLLHIASSNGHPETVMALLRFGADPTLREERGKMRTPYEVADDKETRDAFRRCFAELPGKWDWVAGAGVPSPLTEEMEKKQQEKERERRKKMKEKQRGDAEASGAGRTEPAPPTTVTTSQPQSIFKPAGGGILGKMARSDRESIGMTPERRALLDRQKRALAAEARIRSQQSKCAHCGNPLTSGKTFDKFQFRYCSLECCQIQSKALE